jgi:hypothetical protein
MTPKCSDVPTKKPRVMFTCDEPLKESLEAWAEHESRTVSNLVELIVRQAAKDAGHLQDSAQGDGK